MILPHQSGERGYIKRLNAFWKEKGLFEGYQRLCDQERIIKVGWLSEMQLEEIRRPVDHP